MPRFPFLVTPLLLASLLLSPASQAAGAGCALRDGERLLLVQGGPANQWSLPAGYIDGEETGQQAAARETLEETGLAVRVGLRLPCFGESFRLYACQTLQPMPISDDRLNLLNAPHLGSEVIQAGLFTRQQAAALPLRYPAQIARLFDQLDSIPDSQTEDHADFRQAAPAIQQQELPLIQSLQQATPGWGGFFRSGSFLGEVWFYVLCLPFVALALGRRYLHRMAYWLALLSMLTQGLKSLLALPRPFHYLPALSERGAAGFGMPSGHAFSALFFLGALAFWCRARLPLKWTLPLALLLATWTAMARVWLGVHFISDVLAGLTLAALLIALERWQWRHEAHAAQPAECRRLPWLLLALASLIVGVITRQATQLLPLGLALGYALPTRRDMLGVMRWPETGWMLAGLLLVLATSLGSIQLLTTFWQQALAGLLGFLLLGAWAAQGAQWSWQAIHRRSR
ncbi:phosphatase PAP2 family protein [Paludibacterium sp. B53371]|uniref:bifunctional NUDIX hydrolase/phosphatase PAP2 family protein n=1 Tax=Paludibacterium sp. B53371 TaxID=2806263 RepID=UPI001C04E836|nr:phosphatase PAP2 family protein [Paludibacterium sp. B53371]